MQNNKNGRLMSLTTEVGVKIRGRTISTPSSINKNHSINPSPPK
jgi:hypothetical protein